MCSLNCFISFYTAFFSLPFIFITDLMNPSFMPSSPLILSITPFSIFVCRLSLSSIYSNFLICSSQLSFTYRLQALKERRVFSSSFLRALFYFRVDSSWSSSSSSYSVFVFPFHADFVKLDPLLWGVFRSAPPLNYMMDSVILLSRLSIFFLFSSISKMASFTSETLILGLPSRSLCSEPSVTHNWFLSLGKLNLGTRSSPSIRQPSRYQQALLSPQQSLLIQSSSLLNCLMASMWYPSGVSRIVREQLIGRWNSV